VVAGAATLVTVLVLPFGGRQLGPSVSFVPALLSVVACFDIMSAYLLIGDYRDRGDVRLLVMACAYLWSLTVMAGYALAFPGVVSAHPPLALVPSMAPYFYVAWHGGFPILLAAAWAPWPARWTKPTPLGSRRVVGLVMSGGAAAAGLVVVSSLAALAHHLPVLINGLDTSRMRSLTAPFTLPLVLLALAVTLWGTRTRTGPERWSTVAVLVCLLDLLLTYSSRTRYSLGWYTGRSLTLLSAGVVLLAMLATFRRLKAEAEHDAVFDALTGLLNRRGAYTTVDQLVARARRSGAQLGVVSFDLDFFKQVNDRHGHEAGDRVLAEVGRVMTALSRQGDVIARVGGEEFLALLPDTDLSGAALVAERIRKRIAAIEVPSGHQRVTVSLGATALEVEDLDAAMLLRRADNALYQAKEGGRDLVVSLDSHTSGPLHCAQVPQHQSG
jgi:diguanylate cyclase (GGDEF)-like protein